MGLSAAEIVAAGFATARRVAQMRRQESTGAGVAAWPFAVVFVCGALVGNLHPARAADTCSVKLENPERVAQRLIGEAWLRDHAAGIPGYNDSSTRHIPWPVIKWLSDAAEEGDAEAQWVSAKILMYGKHCGFGTYKWPQPATIERYLLAAAEAGLEKARYSLARFYWFDDPEYKDGPTEGVAYFAGFASTGDAVAEAYIARAYECGRGVGKDRAEAMHYYKAVSNAPSHEDDGYHSASADLPSQIGYKSDSVDLQKVGRAGLERLLTWDAAAPAHRENMEKRCRVLWDVLSPDN